MVRERCHVGSSPDLSAIITSNWFCRRDSRMRFLCAYDFQRRSVFYDRAEPPDSNDSINSSIGCRSTNLMPRCLPNSRPYRGKIRDLCVDVSLTFYDGVMNRLNCPFSQKE
jgi:hypothetical protein